jgi:uncharacterized membrane protein required for colicin V production
MPLRHLISNVKAGLGALVRGLGVLLGVALWLVIAVVIIALISRACPGDHAYMGIHL